MNVLLVHHGDRGWGGGQIAMNNLQVGLRKAGVNATVLCGEKTRPDSVAIPRWPRVEKLIGRFTKRVGLNDVHCVSSFGIKKLEAYRHADVIDFHCIHHDFFSYLALPWLTEEKPAVFTLHDMWPFTGHCHNSLDCERWRIGCGKCPYPETEPAIDRDATHIEWKLKNWIYARSRFILVAPSTWLLNLAKQSMLGRFPVHLIPHGIDTDVYRAMEPEKCRAELGIPRDKRVILFAVDNFARYLKGGDLLQKALLSLPASLKRETLLLLLGKGGEAFAKTVDLPALTPGYVDDPNQKAILYSSADIVVSPTRAESFSLVLLEGMACGTPLVSFRIGGVTDLVRPGINGYLAEPEDAGDLARGIESLLADRNVLLSMRQRCRDIVLAEYSLDLQTKRYVAVYQSALVHPN